MDNNSTDDTATVARSLWPDDAPAPLRIVHEPLPGTGRARQRGLAAARYELLSIVDDDNWVAQNWVETVATVMAEHPLAAVCGGPNQAVPETEPPNWFVAGQHAYAVGPQVDQDGDVTWPRGYLWGAGMTVRGSAWRRLLEQGFTQFLIGSVGKQRRSGEDVELCFALALAGWRIHYDSRLRLQHFIPAYRLTPAYALTLYAQNGAANALTQPYRSHLKQLLAPTEARQANGRDERWARQVWLAAKATLRAQVRARRMHNSSPEAFVARLKAHERLHKWWSILSQRKTYFAIIRALDTARWRTPIRAQADHHESTHLASL